jgi:hypothetical protein
VSKPVNLGPWSKGINNTTRAYALPTGSKDNPGWACADALNVDFTNQGFAVSRSGYSQTQAMLVGHSLATVGDKTLICQARRAWRHHERQSAEHHHAAHRAVFGPDQLRRAGRRGVVEQWHGVRQVQRRQYRFAVGCADALTTSR